MAEPGLTAEGVIRRLEDILKCFKCKSLMQEVYVAADETRMCSSCAHLPSSGKPPTLCRGWDNFVLLLQRLKTFQLTESNEARAEDSVIASPMRNQPDIIPQSVLPPKPQATSIATITEMKTKKAKKKKIKSSWEMTNTSMCMDSPLPEITQEEIMQTCELIEPSTKIVLNQSNFKSCAIQPPPVLLKETEIPKKTKKAKKKKIKSSSQCLEMTNTSIYINSTLPEINQEEIMQTCELIEPSTKTVLNQSNSEPCAILPPPVLVEEISSPSDVLFRNPLDEPISVKRENNPRRYSSRNEKRELVEQLVVNDISQSHDEPMLIDVGLVSVDNENLDTASGPFSPLQYPLSSANNSVSPKDYLASDNNNSSFANGVGLKTPVTEIKIHSSFDKENNANALMNETSKNEMIHMSVKELKELLESAEKKGQEKMREWIQSTAKKQPACKPWELGDSEQGVFPLALDISSTARPSSINIVPETCSMSDDEQSCPDDGELESDNDNFVPPTPQNDRVAQVSPTRFIATGLSNEDKKIVSEFTDKFSVILCSQLNCNPDLVVSGQTAVTLKWLYARVKGIPVIAVDWLEQCIKSGEEVDWEPYVLERPRTVPVPPFFHKLEIVLYPPFAKYSTEDLTVLLLAAGAKMSSFEDWSRQAGTAAAADTNLKLIVGDGNAIPLSQVQLIELWSKHKVPIVDIGYLLFTLESGVLSYLQPHLIVVISDVHLKRLGFPIETLTPNDDD